MCKFAKNILKNNRGMALLLAVTVMSLLVAVTVEFNKNMRFELVGSATVKDNSQLNAIMKSGYNLASAVLIEDINNSTAAGAGSDSLFDNWANLSSSNLSQLFSKGSLTLTVEDQAGKLQLNSLADTNSAKPDDFHRNALRKLLKSGDFGDLSPENIDLIVAAITDWVDTNDNEHDSLQETESSYYLSLNPSYSCKNAPFEHVEELLLVRGITKELYFGTSDFKALRDYVTVHGVDGKLNLATASATILNAFHIDMDKGLADKMIAFREDENNETLLNSNDWYQRINSWPQNVTFDPKKVTTISSFFDITARAKYVDMNRTLYATVERTANNEIRLISRKVE